MTTRPKRHYPRRLKPGTRAFIHLTPDEFDMLGLDNFAPGTFRETEPTPWRTLAGDIVTGDNYAERFDIRLGRVVVSLRWNRMVDPILNRR